MEQQALPKPFNEHDPLPWLVRNKSSYLSPGITAANGQPVVYHSHNNEPAFTGLGPNGTNSAAFIVHAVNTFYQREAELQRLRSQVEAMRVADIEEVRKALGFIKDIGERHPATPNDQTIALHNIVKWANHGLASLNPTPTTETK